MKSTMRDDSSAVDTNSDGAGPSNRPPRGFAAPGRSTGNRILVLAALILSVVRPEAALADGSETLNPPSIAIATGTGIVGAGARMAATPYVTLVADVPVGRIRAR